MEIPYNIATRPDTGMYNSKLGIWLFLASEVMLFGGLFTAYIILRTGAEPGTWPVHLLNVPIGLLNTFLLVVSSISMVCAWMVLKTRNFRFWYRFWLGLTILLGAAFLGVKSTEYYDKAMHYSLWVKDGAYQNYQKEVEADHLFVGDIQMQLQHIHELRGHYHGETATTITVVPDKEFVPFADKMMSKEAPAVDEEKEMVIQKCDLYRYSNFLPACNTFCAIYFTITGLHALHIVGGIVVMLYFWGPGASLYRRNPEHLANRIEVFGIFWHFVDLVWISAFPILYLF